MPEVENLGGVLDVVSYGFACDEGPSGEFRVYRLRFSEEINGDYDLDLDLATEELGADTDAFLGAACTLEIGRSDHVRSVHGIIMAVDYIGRSEDQLFVNVRIVPAFYLLGQQVRSRIFQEMSVQEILDEVLGEALGMYARTLDAGNKARGVAVRDYCVQYRESDLDFCVRLMEEEGISYHFAHSDDVDHEVLTLTYDNTDFGDVLNVDGTAVVPIITTRAETAEVESIKNLDYLQTLTTTSHRRLDYDFLTPLALLVDDVDGADTKGFTRRIYRHTDRRFISDDVADRNKDHLEAQQARGKVGRGTGIVTGFCAGRVFEIERHIRDDLETQFLITRVVHTGDCPEVVLASAAGDLRDAGRYRNSFQCIPLSVPMRPKQARRKPRSYGPETAIVTGPAGEEVHVDEHGRIKVQMHWEEEPKYDDTSSAWIRVRQSWSGPGWGFQFIPRVGQEVVVEFLGGDPDRPLVTGTVYNGDNAYPYAMPVNKTQSGIKTDSVSGDGSNELRFEDMAGSEEVYIHCQKDFTIATENDKNQTTGHDETLTIGNDRTKEVGHDQRERVKNDKSIAIDGNHTETIGKDMQLTVQGNRKRTVVKNDDETILGDHSQTIAKNTTTTVGIASAETVGTNKNVRVGALYTEEVGGARAMTVGAALGVTAGGVVSVQAGEALTLTSGDAASSIAAKDQKLEAGVNIMINAGKDLTIKAGKKALIEAADQLTIQVGSAKIVMKKNGDISINGKNVSIKGSGPVAIKGTKVNVN